MLTGVLTDEDRIDPKLAMCSAKIMLWLAFGTPRQSELTAYQEDL
jgi:hypothetical protein